MKSKLCPICHSEMVYQPQQHWTGMRYITLQHVWVCNKQKDHFLRLMEKVSSRKE